MMAMHARGVVVRRVDVDALRLEVNLFAGSVGLRALDSFPGSGHIAAHGGLLGLCTSGGESEHGDQEHDARQHVNAA